MVEANARAEAALRAYLARLGRPGPVRLGPRVAVTGQQAGLLGGPSLVALKVHSARLHAGPEGTPVFWIASQDHDTDEVHRLVLLDEHEQLRFFSLALPRGVPVGRLPWAPYLDRLAAFLGRAGFAPERTSALLDALAPAQSFSEAFARALLFFFEAEGILPLDPMAEELAPLFTPLIEAELEDPLASTRALLSGQRAARQAGRRAPLGSHPDATQLFLEEADGQRRRLFYRDGRFFTATRGYDRRELSAILAADPSRITPAAALRPVFQDAVLGTGVFVVGPGELDYVLELGPVYRRHGLTRPRVAMRLMGLFVEPPVARLLDRLGVDAWAFVEAPEPTFRAVLMRRVLDELELDGALQQIGDGFKQAARALAGLDPTLVASARASERRVARELDRLWRRAVRARLARDRALYRQYRRLRRHLLPGGRRQDLVYAFAGYFLRYGEHALEVLRQAPGEGRVELRL